MKTLASSFFLFTVNRLLTTWSMFHTLIGQINDLRKRHGRLESHTSSASATIPPYVATNGTSGRNASAGWTPSFKKCGRVVFSFPIYPTQQLRKELGKIQLLHGGTQQMAATTTTSTSTAAPPFVTELVSVRDSGNQPKDDSDKIREQSNLLLAPMMMDPPK